MKDIMDMTIYNGDWHLREREIKKKYKDVV
jgi:hypothetical protein